MATSWVEELLTQGRAEGEAKAILTTLKARFGNVPESLAQNVMGYNDPAALESLTILAATCASLDEFQKEMK